MLVNRRLPITIERPFVLGWRDGRIDGRASSFGPCVRTAVIDRLFRNGAKNEWERLYFAGYRRGRAEVAGEH